MAATEVTDRIGPDTETETVIFGDLCVGDRLKIGGHPETVVQVQLLDGGHILVRTEASVLVREHTHRVEIMRRERV